MIFVFGSNRAGIHGAGAARYAFKVRQAKWGVGEGPTGTCYALPTKGYQIEKLTLAQIGDHVEQFLEYAQRNPELTFQVTAVGTGLGGWTHEDIAPMFMDAPENCRFDIAWKFILGDDHQYWGTF